MPATNREYVAWAEFRYQIRRWLRVSEEAARAEGVPPQQHQLLLALRGFPSKHPPLITDLAERLQLRHHSVVGLIDRMQDEGLVERREGGTGRATNIVLTDAGAAVLERVSKRLRPELETAAEALIASLTPLVTPRTGRRSTKTPSAPE